MSKSKQQPPSRDFAELLLLGGALWLGLRGRDPAEIAARAQHCADTARALLASLERAAQDHLRNAAGCRAPAACHCVICVTEGVGQS